MVFAKIVLIFIVLFQAGI